MANFYKDNDKQFIFEMMGKFIQNKRLIKCHETPDMYILAELTKLVDEGDMAYNTMKRIFPKIIPTVDELLTKLGV